MTSAAAEIIGNQILMLDNQANEGLAQFKDKIIRIKIEDLELSYCISFPNQSLVISEFAPDNRKINATIGGNLSAYLNALSSDNSSDAIFKGDLSFSGDVRLAQNFQAYLQSLNLDWAKPVTELFGDEIAYVAANSVQRMFTFLGHAINESQKDIPEYFQEEIRVLPTATELEYFYRQIDLVRSQTDRLSARIQRLKLND